ncbi:MAG: DUF2178 domain-containing protein [Bacillota bacterium]|nr:DUF2178 domain-containing protein [Bacillota bacterium]
MKLKSQKIYGFVLIAIGIVLDAVFAYLQSIDYKGGVICGMGTTFIFIGLIYLLRVRRLSKNKEKAADYEAAVTDERTAYIVSKARSATFYICIFAQLIAALLCIFLFDQPLIGQVLMYLTCFQCIVYYVILIIFNKKY